MSGVHIHVDADAEIRVEGTGYTSEYRISIGDDVVLYLPPWVAAQLRDQLIEKLG